MNLPSDFITFFTILAVASILFPDVSRCEAQPPLEATDGRIVLRKSPDSPPSPAAPQPSPDIRPVPAEDDASPPPVRDNPAEETVENKNPVFQNIVGERIVYAAKKGESLRRIGTKMGVDWRSIARENRLDPSRRLEPGRKLVIDTRRIIPKSIRSGIVINIPDQTLYMFRNNQAEKIFPVGLGRKRGKKPAMWHTPTGNFRITGKQKNPVWHVPISIREEMKQKKRNIITAVPPGSRNPLGKYALRTSLPGIMIHGTTAPDSVYRFGSHGCIRMLNENIRELFNHIGVRTKGEIIYQPVKMAVTDDGRVFLQVHEDIYKKYKNLETEVKRLIGINNAESMVDWQKIRDSLMLKSGMLSDVTLENVPRHTAKAAP